MTESLHTSSPEETAAAARTVARHLLPGDIVTLSGDLGAGKSVFARAIAASLGVTDRMTSPTYTIVAEYRGSVPVYHIDLYRIADETEFDMLGLDDVLYGSGVSLVEWPDRAPYLRAEARLDVVITIGDADSRSISLEWKRPA